MGLSLPYHLYEALETRFPCIPRLAMPLNPALLRFEEASTIAQLRPHKSTRERGSRFTHLGQLRQLLIVFGQTLATARCTGLDLTSTPVTPKPPWEEEEEDDPPAAKQLILLGCVRLFKRICHMQWIAIQKVTRLCEAPQPGPQ